MHKAGRRDCIEVCEHYGKCFDLATGERDPVFSKLFEAIMHSGDECPHEGRGGENCAISRASQAVLEFCRDGGISLDGSALQYYEELPDEDRNEGRSS